MNVAMADFYGSYGWSARCLVTLSYLWFPAIVSDRLRVFWLVACPSVSKSGCCHPWSVVRGGVYLDEWWIRVVAAGSFL